MCIHCKADFFDIVDCQIRIDKLCPAKAIHLQINKGWRDPGKSVGRATHIVFDARDVLTLDLDPYRLTRIVASCSKIHCGETQGYFGLRAKRRFRLASRDEIAIDNSEYVMLGT